MWDVRIVLTQNLQFFGEKLQFRSQAETAEPEFVMEIYYLSDISGLKINKERNQIYLCR